MDNTDAFHAEGVDTAARVDDEAGLSARQTYMLLWNPAGFAWDESARLEILDATLNGESLADSWSVYANRRRIADGDRVFLRKTGRQNPGIITSGWVVGDVYISDHWDTSRTDDAWFVDVEWDAMVDLDEVLDLTWLSGEFPHSVWTAAGGGARVPDDAAAELEREWERCRAALEAPVEGPDGVPETYRDEIERKYASTIARTRRHQRAFRKLLLANREPRCAYPECEVENVKVLEAAHIVPDADGGESTLENGLLLCPNHHKAMDLAILGFDGTRFRWAKGIAQF